MYKNDSVPIEFPSTIKINASLNRETGILKFKNLHSKYQKFTDNKEFSFFIENILAKVNPKYSNFTMNKTRLFLSKMFTVTDEAFTLTMVLNQFTNWKELAKEKIEDHMNV